MRKTQIDKIPNIPEGLTAFIDGAKLFDSSCSPEARVYFIDKGEGYYLKRAEKGALEKEKIMTEYFHKKGLGTEVVCSIQDESCDWLLTAALKGEDCTYFKYLENPKRLCDTIAERLRELHELDFSDCPITDRNEYYLATAEKNYRNGVFDSELLSGELKFDDREAAFSLIEREKSSFKSDVLLHGDYCLPNIMLDNWNFSAFIDLGLGGVGDRHIDLFWGAWTLNFNLKTDKYRPRFFDAYGRDKVSLDMIRVIAAAEHFG